jgi:PAS domain S-box-containing protein
MDQRRPENQSADDARYRLLVDAVMDYAICMLDPHGTVTSWNAGARRFKAFEAWEIIGQNFARFHTEEDRRSGLPERALKIAAEEGRFEHEGWRVRKDGSRFWTHVVIHPIRNAGGELIGYAEILRDLSERKRAEEQFRKSEEQFKLLVQGVTDYAIYMLDREGRVSSWNLGAERIKGYTFGEIIGSHFSKFYTPEDVQSGLPQRALKMAATEGKFEHEGWRVRKDGTRFWASVVLDPIRDADGEIVGFAKITRDITERREAAKKLEEAREALFQSQKMEAIGQLTGGIAHDFNNLLMAVLGSLELMTRRIPDDPKLKRLIDNAMQGARRGVSLTQRMLAFARRQELKLRNVDIPAMIDGMSELLQRALGKSVIVRANFPSSLPPVRADVNQLELAIINLAVNARDAMPEGGTIKISAHAEGGSVCLSVSDNGEGMDEETLARATEPFFTTKGIGKGTGLGLSMVHGVAEQIGGRLVLKSRKGEGTTAELWLPVADSEADPGEPGRAHPSAESRTIKPLTILAVDDDNLVLVNTAAMLEDLGHKVLSANSAAQALEMFDKDGAIDLVVTDQVMPRMTGRQLADAIRAKAPDIPVILATGFAETNESEERGIVRLSKPFDQSDLNRALATALNEQANLPA